MGTTIHWHGVNLPPEMDGPVGLNQAAVEPGETFVYEFVATPAGTRWYHSHADPTAHISLGLYGSLILEPREPRRTYDRKDTYMLNEGEQTILGITRVARWVRSRCGNSSPVISSRITKSSTIRS